MHSLDSFQPITAIATTPQSAKTLQPLAITLGIKIWVPQVWEGMDHLQVYEGSLATHLQQLWPHSSAVVFGLAMGATVRLIAPLLSDKNQDPAVVVVDANGQFVISVCGGHRQGADQLTQGLSALLQAQAILTGASASAHWPGLDTLGLPFGWQPGPGDWTKVAALLAQNAAIALQQTAGSVLWQAMLPSDHPLTLNKENAPHPQPEGILWIGSEHPPQFSKPAVVWHPRTLWIGIGCERGTSAQLIRTAIDQVLQTHQLSQEAIAGVASLDLKQDELGLCEVCQSNQWPFFTFDAETLAGIDVPNPSEVVRQAVETPSVAEASALAATQQYGSWQQATLGQLIAPKSVHRDDLSSGAVTIAIAKAEREWIGSSGHLSLIGCGPGNLDQMTPAAQTALTQVDVVIGYQLYIDLVQARLRPGQIIEASNITQERARAQRAIELAQWGLKVAVISSGDSGIYGMAGLILEELETQGWDGRTPSVEILPGISALQAAASRVGTPLMHDFCAISLSDLLTPWEVIEKRLTAAAAADFITALYNPKSKTRQIQLARAQEIFLSHRDPKTPIAIVRSAYREDEYRQCATLGELHQLDVDMLTLVLIGNQSTRLHHDWMITPRGYLGFEG